MKRTFMLWLVASLLFFSLPLFAGGKKEAEGATTVEGGPKYGGELTVIPLYGHREPLTFDPGELTWSASWWQWPYMETLMQGDVLKKGPRGTNEFAFQEAEWIPDIYVTGRLSESWQLLDNPLRVEFKMRQGIMWQGKENVLEPREVVAQDAAFSLNRLTSNPKFSGWLGFVGDIYAKDDRTLVVEFKEYSSDWMKKLGWYVFVCIYPPELVDAGVEDWKNAVGSGPFKLTDFVQGSYLSYERNDDYWRSTTIDGKEYKIPLVDKYTRLIVAEDTTALAALQTGKVDIVEELPGQYKDLLDKTNPELKSWPLPKPGLFSVAMRTDEAPFDDLRVRQAVWLAVNNQEMLETLFGEGQIQPYPMSASWGEAYYTPVDKLPAGTRELYGFDPDKAKQLLTDAGYPDGFNTSLTIEAQADAVDLAAAFMAYLKDLGINVDLKTVNLTTLESLRVAKDYAGMFMTEGGVTSPTTTLYAHYEPGWKANTAIADNPSYNKLYPEILATRDGAKQAALIKELSVELLSEAYYFYMPRPSVYRYAQPWIQNYYGENNVGYFDAGPIYGSLWIDEAMRK